MTLARRVMVNPAAPVPSGDALYYAEELDSPSVPNFEGIDYQRIIPYNGQYVVLADIVQGQFRRPGIRVFDSGFNRVATYNFRGTRDGMFFTDARVINGDLYITGKERYSGLGSANAIWRFNSSFSLVDSFLFHETAYLDSELSTLTYDPVYCWNNSTHIFLASGINGPRIRITKLPLDLSGIDSSKAFLGYSTVLAGFTYNPNDSVFIAMEQSGVGYNVDENLTTGSHLLQFSRTRAIKHIGNLLYTLWLSGTNDYLHALSVNESTYAEVAGRRLVDIEDREHSPQNGFILQDAAGNIVFISGQEVGAGVATPSVTSFTADLSTVNYYHTIQNTAITKGSDTAQFHHAILLGDNRIACVGAIETTTDVKSGIIYVFDPSSIPTLPVSPTCDTDVQLDNEAYTEQVATEGGTIAAGEQTPSLATLTSSIISNTVNSTDVGPCSWS